MDSRSSTWCSSLMLIYHFPNLKVLFSKAIAISREGHGKIEVISDRCAPMWCLTEIFDFDMQFTDSLLKELKMMNLNSSIQSVTVPGKADFSRCVAEDFTSQYSQYVLNFFCQSNLQRSQLCASNISNLV